jgi:uncharacterized membrane protein YhhN
MMTATCFLLVFGGVACAHLICEGFKLMKARYLLKPLLIPSLSAYYLYSTQALNWFLLAALFACWLGDVFLMIPDPHKTRKYFKPGLVAFLLGHIFYIAVFAPYAATLEVFPVGAWMLSLVFLGMGILGFRLIAPHAGAMKHAIIAYVIVITAMGISTVFALGQVSLGGIILAMAGAFIFMVSDIINAYNKFVAEIVHERIYTMSTYLLGQFLLVQGVLLFA